MSNTTIFQKLFGNGNSNTPRDSSSTPNRFVPEAASTPKAATVGQSFLLSAQQFEKLTPVGSAPRFGEERRRKRPVSAVFGQAMYKLSHSSTTGDIGKGKKVREISKIMKKKFKNASLSLNQGIGVCLLKRKSKIFRFSA